MNERILFKTGSYKLNSGIAANWKIECEALNHDDWAGVAYMLMERLPPFGAVIGVPRGGLPLAFALARYVTKGPVLIVDDVLTTGGTMIRFREMFKPPIIGAVVFARGKCPEWITPLFTMAPVFKVVG